MQVGGHARMACAIFTCKAGKGIVANQLLNDRKRDSQRSVPPRKQLPAIVVQRRCRVPTLDVRRGFADVDGSQYGVRDDALKGFDLHRHGAATPALWQRADAIRAWSTSTSRWGTS